MALLDDRLQGAGDADAVAAHDRGLLLAGFVEEQRVERLAVLGAELEDVADLDGAADLERLAALGARLRPPAPVRRSAQCVTWMSRPMATWRRWKPSSLAPVVMSAASRRRSSA